MKYEIKAAYDNIDAVRFLFWEYAKSLNINLDFQDFENELANLPYEYSLPKGRLYLAYDTLTPIGCVAMRPLNDTSCELKRLYVNNAYRGKHIGSSLVEKIISDAKFLHYKSIFLDTLSSLTASIELYKKMGFIEIEPYRYNPFKSALFFRLDLD